MSSLSLCAILPAWQGLPYADTMYTIAALYRFTPFEDPAARVREARAVLQQHAITGTLLFAREGLNGTIAGTRAGIDAALAYLRTLPGCAELEHKESTAAERPFWKLKVRLKSEIVTMGQPDVDPTGSVGTYVPATEWNALISAPDVAVIDTRNRYETGIGTFEGAIDPETDSFREFPQWWQDNAARFEGKRIAMFCTGGIRCEKSTNYLLSQGVKDVYHLQGGILKYLEEMPEDDSKWSGSCFVFDERVSVEHGLREGVHSLCRACRRPLHPDDLTRNTYEEGVSCHQCYAETSDADKARFRERQRQIALAKARGARHLGPDTDTSTKAATDNGTQKDVDSPV